MHSLVRQFLREATHSARRVLGEPGESRGGGVNDEACFLYMQNLWLCGCPPPPRATPRYTPRAGLWLLKITLAGTDAKAKDNEELVQKAGILKHWCTGRKK
jgi:hypothetical protein